MNTYTHSFSAVCPSNGVVVEYHLTIQSVVMILVEQIIDACTVTETYHEPLADGLYKRFGGHQVMTASHHGVQITTIRGSL